MKIVANIFKNIVKKETPTFLGRWNVDYCYKKINKKIDYSNEDHCGPCGMYKIDITTSYNKVQNDNFISVYEIKN
jgi:hypothetical protein